MVEIVEDTIAEIKITGRRFSGRFKQAEEIKKLEDKVIEITLPKNQKGGGDVEK